MILIALGANLPSVYGSPLEGLRRAANLISREEGMILRKASGIWRTSPVPASEQPDYYNAVIAVGSDLAPRQVLEVLFSIERKFGRERRAPNAPRTLDLDLLCFKGRVLSSGDLTLPHPRMHERGFVLYPLMDIAPDWNHPILKKSPADLLHNISDTQFCAPVESEAV